MLRDLPDTLASELTQEAPCRRLCALGTRQTPFEAARVLGGLDAENQQFFATPLILIGGQTRRLGSFAFLNNRARNAACAPTCAQNGVRNE